MPVYPQKWKGDSYQNAKGQYLHHKRNNWLFSVAKDQKKRPRAFTGFTKCVSKVQRVFVTGCKPSEKGMSKMCKVKMNIG